MRVEERRALVELLRVERELDAAITATVRAWLPHAIDAVLPMLAAAAEIPPDPGAITETAADDWERELDARFMPRVAGVARRLAGPSADRLTDWRARFLAGVRTRLLGAPAAAVKLVHAAVAAGQAAGDAVSGLRTRARQALSWGSGGPWRAFANRTARTEAGAVVNGTRLARAEAEERDTGSELVKTWRCLRDDRVRPTHFAADGQTVPLGSAFTVGGALLAFPHDPNGPPEEVINCRCLLIIRPAQPSDAVAASTTPGGNTMRTFEALLVPAGVIGRSGMWMLSTSADLLDTVLPMPLKWQPRAVPGHDESVTVGVIEKLDMRPEGIFGLGYLMDDSPHLADVEREIEHQVTRPSAELGVRSAVLADAGGNPITPETAAQMMDGGAQIIERWDGVEMMSASLVSVPEFRDTWITVADGEPATDMSPQMALVAAAKNARIVEPARYPAEFFERPVLDSTPPVHVTAQGRVQGYLALHNSTHRGSPDIPRTPYRSHNGYADFHQSTADLDNGEQLAVGRLTVGGGHGPVGKGARAALAHYDDVSTCWAYVRAWDDEHGILVSGAIHFAADEDMVRLALGTPHSGHWERVAGGKPELIAAHAVNSPGFANYYQRAADRRGDLALVASCWAPEPVRIGPGGELAVTVAAAVAEYRRQEAAEQRAVRARTLASDRRRSRALAIVHDRRARHGV